MIPLILILSIEPFIRYLNAHYVIDIFYVLMEMMKKNCVREKCLNIGQTVQSKESRLLLVESPIKISSNEVRTKSHQACHFVILFSDRLYFFLVGFVYTIRHRRWFNSTNL